MAPAAPTVTATDWAVDVLGEPLAQLGVAEVGHVAEAAGADRRGRPLEGLSNRLGRLQGLAQGEVGDRVRAVTLAQPLRCRRAGPHPAPGLDLPADPRGDSSLAAPRAHAAMTFHRTPTGPASVSGAHRLAPPVPPSCQEKG